jgi:lysophospholipase L1-like esterase
VINRGFGGSQMSDVSHYVTRVVLPYKPRIIVVQEGGNDIHSGKTPEQFLSDVKGFIETVQSNLPGVPIVFGCITPNVARWNEVEIRKRTNLLVKNYLAAQKNVHYVDCFDAFLGSDGLPNSELFVADGLHPSAAGYKLRADILRPFLGAPGNLK